MRFWFDTEFYEDGRIIELISIGVAAEDGRTYYAETHCSWELASKTDWLKQNVRPHLRGSILYPPKIMTDLVEFFSREPEIWAYYADYDWVALCQLYGRMVDLPPGWPKYCLDVKQLAWSLGNPQLPPQVTAEHDALQDAIWTADAWRYLQRYKDELDGVRLVGQGGRVPSGI